MFHFAGVLAMSAAVVMQQDTGMQHMQMPHDTSDMAAQMLMANVAGLNVMAMAQAFPTYTAFAPRERGTALAHSGFYITQPALMANVSNHDAGVVLRATLNFESWTQPHGELSAGAWGEGYIDKRHPHTLLHELTLSVNRGTAERGLSVTVGKGFAPFGTDDPMSRPAVKYPTNHHLSQVLERWIASGVLAYHTWGLELGVFGGDEPTGPHDLGNYHHFGNSVSARLTKRMGASEMARWPLEISASYAHVVETHTGADVGNDLWNAAIRHEATHGGARLYALLEASRRAPDNDVAYHSVLGETAVRFGRHQPYARVELSTRPEYARLAGPSQDGFFRYDHDQPPIGATRWLIVTGGYGFNASNRTLSPRPYIEAEYNRVRRERGLVSPQDLFGRANFWSISAGVRIFLGGDPMRMGTYGVLDPMRAMHEMPPMPNMDMHEH